MNHCQRQLAVGLKQILKQLDAKKKGKKKKQSLYTGCTVSSVADSYWREDLEELQARENNGMCPKFRFISGCDKK